MIVRGRAGGHQTVMTWPALNLAQHQIRDRPDEHVVQLRGMAWHRIVSREYDGPRNRGWTTEDFRVEEVAHPDPTDRKPRTRRIAESPHAMVPHSEPGSQRQNEADAVVTQDDGTEARNDWINVPDERCSHFRRRWKGDGEAPNYLMRP